MTKGGICKVIEVRYFPYCVKNSRVKFPAMKGNYESRRDNYNKIYC